MISVRVARPPWPGIAGYLGPHTSIHSPCLSWWPKSFLIKHLWAWRQSMPKIAKVTKKTSKHLKTQYSYGMLWWELEGQYFWLMHIGKKHELVQGGPHSFAKNIPSCPCPRMSQAFCLRFSLSESELTDLFAAPNMRSPQSAKGDIPVSKLPCGCLWHQNTWVDMGLKWP